MPRTERRDMQPMRGWHPGQIETRLAAVEPASYDRKARTVDAVLSRGSPVKRFYGTETLRIHPDAVIMDRIKSGGIPILDSHRQDSITSSLGRLTKTWFDRGPALVGRITFNDTEEGRKAEGMVARGEISAVSAGYRVDTWEIRDSKGKVVDPEVTKVRWDDELSFEATRWEILEASLCAVPADASAVIRSADIALPMTSIFHGAEIDTIRARMLARQHIVTRTAHR